MPSVDRCCGLQLSPTCAVILARAAFAFALVFLTALGWFGIALATSHAVVENVI